MGKLMVRGGASALALCFAFAVSFGQPAPATAPSGSATKRIVFLGDSITAGHGVGEAHAFPALIAAKIRAANLPYEVVNAGVSGDTSADGLHRLDWLLQQKIDVLVLELGANDGLRGLPVAALQANLQAIIDKVKANNPAVRIVIAGMELPPNLGADYAGNFARVFADLARKNNAALIPFLLQGVGGHPDLNQADQIHPTEAGHKVVADTVWGVLEPVLRAK